MTIFLIITLAMVLHEAAHALTARFFGDPTAYLAGRLTLNPLPHIDPVKTILLPVLGYLALGLPVGGMKPIPVNRLYLTDQHFRLVALAGPAAHTVQALLWFLFDVPEGVLVNASLGLFNLLPIRPLDGYHIFRR